MRRTRRWLVAGLAAVVAAGALSAGLVFALDDGGTAAAPAASPTPEATPAGAQPTLAANPLWDARLDAASPRRFNVPLDQVKLVGISEAGWDGCLGVGAS